MTDADKKSVFVDTNILLRYMLESIPEHAEVVQALNLLWERGTQLWISRQIVRELASVLTRPQTYQVPISAADAAHEIRTLNSSYQIAEETTAVGEQLLRLMDTIPMGGKQIHDANIVATMLVYRIPNLFTLNTVDFQRFQPQIQLLTLETVLNGANNTD